MNSFRLPEIIFGCLLTLAVLGLGATIGSQYFPAGQQQAQQHSPDQTADQKRDKGGFWEKTMEDPVAFFTLGLFVFTGVLALSTIGLWIATNTTAKTAERALTELERPFVYIDVVATQIATEAGQNRIWGQHFAYHCINHGRTPADLWEVYEEFHLLRGGRFPDALVPPPLGARKLPPGTVSSPDRPFRFSANLRERVSGDDYGFLRGSLYFIGYLRYVDVFGRHYINGFCAVYDPIGERFVLRGSDKYNYAKREA